MESDNEVNGLVSVLYSLYLLFIICIFLQLKRRLELLQKEYERTAQRLQARVELYHVKIKARDCPVVDLHLSELIKS